MNDTAATAQLMDSVYRHQRHIYDLTRKYYLLGRDHLIRELDPPEGGTVLELGCGTGRNLIVAANRYPAVRFYGLDISRQMLETASANIAKAGMSSRIELIEGDAANPHAIKRLGIPPFDRIFYSYTLSMIPVWREALAAGALNLTNDGCIHVVDFGQQNRLPQWFKSVLFKWLESFHVSPRGDLESELNRLAERHKLALSTTPLYQGYAVYGALQKLGDENQSPATK